MALDREVLDLAALELAAHARGLVPVLGEDHVEGAGVVHVAALDPGLAETRGGLAGNGEKLRAGHGDLGLFQERDGAEAVGVEHGFGRVDDAEAAPRLRSDETQDILALAHHEHQGRRRGARKIPHRGI